MRNKPGLVVLLLSCVVLLACGDEGRHATRPSDPGPASTGEDDLLADLRARLDGEAEILDDGWVRAVGEVALLLWPDASPAALVGRRDHTNLALIAGDVSVQFVAEGPGGRAALEERDETSLAIHDAFRAAVARGPAAYRTWVEGEGKALLLRRVAALQGE